MVRFRFAIGRLLSKEMAEEIDAFYDSLLSTGTFCRRG
jgi:hypothetical protein